MNVILKNPPIFARLNVRTTRVACFRQSKRRTALFLEAIQQQLCSTGLTFKSQSIVMDALRPTYDEMCEQLPSQPSSTWNGTPTKDGTNIWTFVASRFMVYRRRPTREATVLDELLNIPFAGVVDLQLRRDLLKQTKLIFQQWRRHQLLTPHRSEAHAGPVRAELERLLLRGLRGRQAKTSGTCQELLWHHC